MHIFIYLVCLFYHFRVTKASNHQPAAPSLEFSNDSDSDCYIIDGGSEVEIQCGDDTESESVDLGSDDEMIQASESSTGEITETVSDDDNMDGSDDPIYDFDPNVPDRIVWGKPVFSRRFLEVRRKVKRAWRIRDENLSRTLDWGKIIKSRGYQLVKAVVSKFKEILSE